MASFIYFEPSGDRIDNPTLDQMIEFVRQDSEYWGPYSPVGYIYRDDAGVRVVLYFIRHPRRGWYIEHDTRASREHWVAVNPPGNRIGWVEHWAEGETAFFLEACFVSQEVFEVVLRDFFVSPGRSTAVNWEPIHWDIHRRADQPDDDSQVVEWAEDPV